jgi:hypothetical protein
MIFPLFVQKTPANFGGPRAGSQCQELFANLPKFSIIIVPVAQTCLIIINLLHSCKKDLTRDPVAGIMARATCRFCTSVWHWRRRLLRFELFAQKVKKRLDNGRFCTYTGAGTTSVSHVAFALAPPRQKPCQVKPCYLKKR